MAEWRRVGRLLTIAAALPTLAAGCGGTDSTLVRPSSVSGLPGGFSLELNRNAQAFVQDQVWTEGRTQYAVWVNASGSAAVGKRTLPRGGWSTYDLGRLRGNPLALPTRLDEHNVYAVAVDDRGYVHVAGNMHGDPIRWVRSLRPGDITRWTPRGMPAGEPTTTYPRFVRTRSGELLFFFRSGDSGDGDLALRRWYGRERRWGRTTTVIDGRSSGESPYPQHIATDRRRRVHVMYTWRARPDPATTGDLSYAVSPDAGRRWRTSTGAKLPVPITHARSEIILATKPGGPRLSNAGGLDIDSAGTPHAGILVGGRLHHVWREGRRWRIETAPTPRPPVTRPAVFAGSAGDIFLLTTSPQRRGQSTVWAVGVAGDAGRSQRPVKLRDIGAAQSEVTYDTRGASLDGRLRLLLPGRQAPSGGEVVEYEPTAIR